MRILVPFSLTMTLCASVTGCSDGVVPAARGPAVSAGAVGPAAAPNEGMLARLRADDPAALREAAYAIATNGDVATRRAASVRLVAEAQTATSPAALAYLLAAMEVVGGPEVVAYCLALGENESAPAELRKAALAVLVRWADRNDPAVRARSAAIWERVNALPSSPAGASATGGVHRAVGKVSIGNSSIRGSVIPNATQVIAGMSGGFRRCYNRGLHEDVRTSGTIEVTAWIDATGAVSSAQESHTGLTPSLISCIVAGVQAAVFAPPQGGPATLVIPIRFEVM